MNALDSSVYTHYLVWLAFTAELVVGRTARYRATKNYFALRGIRVVG